MKQSDAPTSHDGTKADNSNTGNHHKTSSCAVHHSYVSGSVSPLDPHVENSLTNIALSPSSEAGSISCSCDSTEFDNLLAVMGDKKSQKRLKLAKNTKDYGTSDNAFFKKADARSKSRVHNRVLVSGMANLSTAVGISPS